MNIKKVENFMSEKEVVRLTGAENEYKRINLEYGSVDGKRLTTDSAGRTMPQTWVSPLIDAGKDIMLGGRNLKLSCVDTALGKGTVYAGYTDSSGQRYEYIAESGKSPIKQQIKEDVVGNSMCVESKTNKDTSQEVTAIMRNNEALMQDNGQGLGQGQGQNNKT